MTAADSATPQEHRSSRVTSPVQDDLEYDEIWVWPDEIAVADIYAGYIVTAVSTSEHYRAPARRLTIFTDPAELPDGVLSEEWGRIVIRTDRKTGHKVPVLRPVKD